MISMLTPNPEAVSISEAVERYLAEGGTITRLDIQPRTDISEGFITSEQRASASKSLAKSHRKFYRGEWRTHKELSGMCGIPWRTISNRMQQGMTLEDAMKKPLQGHKA